MATKDKPHAFCEYSEHKNYPFGKFCTIHHKHCENIELEMTDRVGKMIHQAWHRMEVCVKRLGESEADGMLWLLSWHVAGSLRTLDYLPNPQRKMKKAKSLYHKVYLAGVDGSNKRILQRKKIEVEKLVRTLDLVKRYQIPDKEGNHV